MSGTVSSRSWKNRDKEPVSRPIRVFQALVLSTLVVALIGILVWWVLGQRVPRTELLMIGAESYQDFEFPVVEFFENEQTINERLGTDSSRFQRIVDGFATAIGSRFDELNQRRDVAIVYIRAEGVLSPAGQMFLAHPNMKDALDTRQLVEMEDVLAQVGRIPARYKLILLNAGQTRNDAYRGILPNGFSERLDALIKAQADEDLWLICSHNTATQQSYSSYLSERSLFSLAVENALDQCAQADPNQHVNLMPFYRRLLDCCASYSKLTSNRQERTALQTPLLYRGSQGFVTATQAKQFEEQEGPVVLVHRFAVDANTESTSESSDPASSPVRGEDAELSAEQVLSKHDAYFGTHRLEWQKLLALWDIRDEINQLTREQHIPIDFAPHLWRRLDSHLSQYDRQLRGRAQEADMEQRLSIVLDQLTILRDVDIARAGTVDPGTIQTNFSQELLKAFVEARDFKLLTGTERAPQVLEALKSFRDAVFRLQYYVDLFDDLAPLFPEDNGLSNPVEALINEVQLSADSFNQLRISSRADFSRTIARLQNSESQVISKLFDIWTERDPNASLFKKEQTLKCFLDSPLFGTRPQPLARAEQQALTRLRLLDDWASLVATSSLPVVEDDQDWPAKPTKAIYEPDLQRRLLALASPDASPPNAIDAAVVTRLLGESKGAAHWLAASVAEPRYWEDHEGQFRVSYETADVKVPGMAFLNNPPVRFEMQGENETLDLTLGIGENEFFEGTLEVEIGSSNLKVFDQSGRELSSGDTVDVQRFDQSIRRQVQLALTAQRMLESSHAAIRLTMIRGDGRRSNPRQIEVGLPLFDRVELSVDQLGAYEDDPRDDLVRQRVSAIAAANDVASFSPFLRVWTLPFGTTEVAWSVKNLSGKDKSVRAELFSVDLAKIDARNNFAPGRMTVLHPRFRDAPLPALLQRIGQAVAIEDRIAESEELSLPVTAGQVPPMEKLTWKVPEGDQDVPQPSNIESVLICRLTETSNGQSSEYFFFVELYPIQGAQLVDVAGSRASYRDGWLYFQPRIHDSLNTDVLSFAFDVSSLTPDGGHNVEMTKGREREMSVAIANPGESPFFVGININNVPRQLIYRVDPVTRQCTSVGGKASLASFGEIREPVPDGETNRDERPEFNRLYVFQNPDVVAVNLKADLAHELIGQSSGRVVLMDELTGLPATPAWPVDRDIRFGLAVNPKTRQTVELSCTVRDLSFSLLKSLRDANETRNFSLRSGEAGADGRSDVQLTFDNINPRKPTFETPRLAAFEKVPVEIELQLDDGRGSGPAEVEAYRLMPDNSTTLLFKHPCQGRTSTRFPMTFEKTETLDVQFRVIDLAGNPSELSLPLKVEVKTAPDQDPDAEDQPTYAIVIKVNAKHGQTEVKYFDADPGMWFSVQVTGPDGYQLPREYQNPRLRVRDLRLTGLKAGTYKLSARGSGVGSRRVEHEQEFVVGPGGITQGGFEITLAPPQN